MGLNSYIKKLINNNKVFRTIASRFLLSNRYKIDRDNTVNIESTIRHYPFGLKEVKMLLI